MNKKDFKLLIENWQRLFESVEKSVYVYMCSDPSWMGANFKNNFENSAIEESNPYKLVEQIINVDMLYGFESKIKLEDSGSRKKVDDIKDLIIRGEDSILPPVLVRYKKEGNKDFQVIDGHHRYWAYEELREEEGVTKGVRVRIVPGEMIRDVMLKEDLPE